MKPIKVNYTKNDDARTSTTINGQIAEAYFKTLFAFNTPERLAACTSKANYVNAISISCQAYINRQKWQDKPMMERYLLQEIIDYYRLPF